MAARKTREKIKALLFLPNVKTTKVKNSVSMKIVRGYIFFYLIAI